MRTVTPIIRFFLLTLFAVVFLRTPVFANEIEDLFKNLRYPDFKEFKYLTFQAAGTGDATPFLSIAFCPHSNFSGNVFWAYPDYAKVWETLLALLDSKNAERLKIFLYYNVNEPKTSIKIGQNKTTGKYYVRLLLNEKRVIATTSIQLKAALKKAAEDLIKPAPPSDALKTVEEANTSDQQVSGSNLGRPSIALRQARERLRKLNEDWKIRKNLEANLQ